MSQKTLTSQQKLTARVGKVLSHQSSKGGFSTALMYEPDDLGERAHGRLFFVIDIASPLPLSPDIAYNLIDIIKEEYYRDLAISSSDSFENALKAANDELVAIYKEGVKDWLGKFNCVIAALNKDSLHLVQRGTAEIHMLRGTNVINLSKGMYTPGENYRPEETLVNLLDGEVEIGDKFIMSTSELFYYVSLEKLKRMVENVSPAEAAKKLAVQLGNELDINRTSVLIAEFTLPELVETEEENAPSENWIGQPKAESTTPIRSNRSLPQYEDSVDLEKTVGEALDEKESFTSPVQTRLLENDDISIEHVSDAQTIDYRSSDTDSSTPSFEALKNSLTNFGDYKDKLKIDSKQLEQAGSLAVKFGGAVYGVLKSGGSSLLHVISNQVRQIKKRKDGDKILLGLVAGIVIVIVGSTIGISKGYTAGVSNKKAIAAMSDANQKRDEAQAALIYGDTPKARGLLAEAFVLAQQATNNKRTKDEATGLVATLEKQLDEVNGVKRFKDVQAVANFSDLNSQLGEGNTAQMGQIAVLGGNLYAIDPTNNKIYKYNPNSGDKTIVNSLSSNDRKLALVTPLNEKELVLYTNPPALYSLNTENNTIGSIALDSGNWNNALSLLAYTNKLYLLDPANNDIWRYQTVPEGYTKVAAYFEGIGQVNLAGALDFAIDGSVLVLLPSNVVHKFSGGIETTFKLSDIPAPYPALGELTQLTVDSKNQVYLLDSTNNRVLVFDKDGAYLSQFIFDNIQSPTNLMIDEAAGALYLTSGTGVYRLPLK